MALDGLTRFLDELFDVERFGQVVIDAVLHEADSFVHLAISGHDDDWNVRIELCDRPCELVALQFGHLHVGDDEVEDLLADEVETDLPVARSNDVVAFAFEPGLQHPLHAGVIIDNKNLWPNGLLHSDGSISCF